MNTLLHLGSSPSSSAPGHAAMHSQYVEGEFSGHHDARTLPPRHFTHSVIGMGQTDLFTYRNANFIPVRKDNAGYVMRADTPEQPQIYLTHQEIFELLDTKKASVKYSYNSVAMQIMRATFGDKSWDAFKLDDRQLALHKEKLIKRYDVECEQRCKRLPMSEAKLGPLLQAWNDEITERARKEASAGRADQSAQVVVFGCPSARTFKRDYDDYHNADMNVMALLPRHHGPGHKLFATAPEAIAFAHRAACDYMDRRRPTMAHVYRAYLSALHAHNKDLPRPTQLQKVSRKKFESIISKFDKFHVLASRYGEKHAIDKFKAVRESFQTEVPGQRVEMDFFTVDLMSLLVETGIWNALPSDVQSQIPRKRISFCAAIDVATRYVLGFKASTNPKAASAVACIRMIMSDKRHLSSYVGAQTPWVGKLRPRMIYTDNGSEFIAEQVLDVLREARINATRPPAGQPDCRPFIESLFHSIGPLVTPYFDGRTFSSVVEKGDYDPQAHATLLVDELIEVFIFAICDIYHNKPHSGLGGNTPHNAWDQATKEYEILYPPDREEMLKIFGLKAERAISDYGVTLFGITYCNEGLQRLRTKVGTRLVQVKFDPECPAHILVYGDKGWFVVRNTVGLEDDVTLEEWMAARKELRDHYSTAAERGMKVMYDAINRLRSIGKAATLRAGLTPTVRTAKDYERLDSELYGAWAAIPSDDAPGLVVEGPLPFDPLRIGMVAPAEVLFENAKKARDAATKVKEAAVSEGEELGDRVVSAFDFDEEY